MVYAGAPVRHHDAGRDPIAVAGKLFAGISIIIGLVKDLLNDF
jgi:hypothetical protein